MKTLNVRFVAILLIGVVVVGGAVEGLRRFQVWRKAGFYLEQADKAIAEAEDARDVGDSQRELAEYEEAEKNYSWYVRLRRGDTDVLEKLGLLQAELSQMTLDNGPRDTPAEKEVTRANAGRWLQMATSTLLSALRQERSSDRTAARRKLVDIYYSNYGRYSDAVTHLTALLEKSPDDGELWELLGSCQMALRENDKAAESFQRAISVAPDRANSYTQLARLLANANLLNRPAEADQWMRKLLEANPESFQAHVAYGRYLVTLTTVGSSEEVRNHPILLDAMVPAVLSQAVQHAVDSLKLTEEDPDAQLLAKNKSLLERVVREALKTYNGNLALDDPDALWLAARPGAEIQTPDAEALKQARDQVIEALESEEASEDLGVLPVAAKHGVLVEAMRLALGALGNPNVLFGVGRESLLDEAVGHALLARQLVAHGRDALTSLFLREFSSHDHEAIRLAQNHGVLLKALKGALNPQSKDMKRVISPAVLGRTAGREVLVDAVKDAVRSTINAAELSDDESRALNGGHGVLVDLIRHALRDCELASTDRDALIQTGKNGVLTRVCREALEGRHGILAKAVKDVLRAESASSASPSSVDRKVLAEAAQRAIEANGLPEEERDVLLLAVKHGVLMDVIRLALNDPDLASHDRDDLLQSAESSVLARALRRSLSARERVLEIDDRVALSLATRCALAKREFDRARECADRGVEAYPEASMYLTSAEVARLAGDQAEAIAILEEGLTVIPRSASLLWDKANRLLDMGDVDRVPQAIHDMNDADYSATDHRQIPPVEVAVGYLEACHDYAQGNWLAAIQRFEKGRGGLTAWPSLLKQADYQTARCYGELENVDQELRAYRRALDIDPFYFDARRGLASALHKAGRVEDALREIQQLMQWGVPSQSGWLQLAGLLLDKNSRLEPSQRNWAEVEQVLKQAEEAGAGSIQLVLLRMNLLLAQADEQELLARQQGSAEEQRKALDRAQELLGQAERLIQAAHEKDRKQVQLWTALAQLAQRRGDWDRVERLLDEAGQEAGDSVTLRMARAAYLAARLGRKAGDQLRQLAEGAGGFTKPERLQLWRVLAVYAGRVGGDQQAEALLRRVADESPNDLQVRLDLLLHLAFRSKDDAGIKEMLEEVEKVEGKGPRWHYGEALRLRLLAGRGDATRLDEALKHVVQAQKLYPTWSPPVVLAAHIYLAQGKPSRALPDYLRAINEMGSRAPDALLSAADLLYRAGRYVEAAKMVRLLEDQQLPLGDEMIRLVRNIKLGAGDLDGAMELAIKAADGSEDYLDHFSLGRVRAAKAMVAINRGQTEEAKRMFGEAEKSLRRAVELNEDVPEVWMALIQFLASMGETEKAEEALKQARTKIPADQRPLALARAYELMRRPELAEQSYEEALAAAPDDPRVARDVADFFWRKGQLPQADPAQASEAILRAQAILKRIIGGEVKSQQTDVLWARRLLALILRARGGYTNLQEALNLIEQNLAAAGPSAEDLRFKANLLVMYRDPERLKEAAQILEKLPSEQRSETPQDRFMLWQLYLAEGAWAKASAQMRSLLATHGNEPLYVAAYTGALLGRKETQDAELWLNRLKTIAPYWFSPRDLTTTTSLQAELLFQRGQYAEALDLLNRFVGNVEAQPVNETERTRLAALSLEQFGRRLADLGQTEMAERFLFDAETLCRKYSRQRLGQEWFLALFLARQGRIEEALRLLESMWRDGELATTAGVSLNLLRNPAASGEQLQRVETVVQAALKRFDRPGLLLLVMAQACASQARYPEAEKYYREVIEKSGGHFGAMNNLAVLLALQKTKLTEALKLVNQAIELAGPAGPILDTRATVYMALGKPDKALEDLKAAIAEEATPGRHFHQALAYQQSGRQEAAIEALQQAQKLGLRPEMLEPLERPTYQGLLKLLK